MHVVDTLIEYFDPVGAVRRKQARALLQLHRELLNSGYSESGASSRKPAMKGWTDKSRDPVGDIGDNLVALRRNSRSLYQNVDLARGAVDRLKVWAIGTGLRLRATPNAPLLGLSPEEARRWGDAVEARFEHWARRHCDAAGLFDFYALQRLALTTWLHSGDCFALPVMLDGQTLQTRLLEADYCFTPGGVSVAGSVVNGVETDAAGRVAAYWFSRTHPDALAIAPEAPTRYAAVGASGVRRVLHILEPERTCYYRGVPYLAPVVESFRQLGQYSRAEIAAALTSTIFTAAIYQEQPNLPLGDLAAPATPSDDGVPEYTLGSGNILRLGTNEKIQSIASDRPNQNFGTFIDSYAQNIGAALNTPADIMRLKYDASYSASRAANVAFVKWADLARDVLTRRFVQPLYEEWLTLEVLAGRVAAPGFAEDPVVREAWLTAAWFGPAWGSLDPYKEVMAAEKMIGLGLSTRAQVCTEITGRDWDAVIAENAEEVRRMRELGLAEAAPAGGTAP